MFHSIEVSFIGNYILSLLDSMSANTEPSTRLLKKAIIPEDFVKRREEKYSSNSEFPGAKNIFI